MGTATIKKISKNKTIFVQIKYTQKNIKGFTEIHGLKYYINTVHNRLKKQGWKVIKS